MITDNIIRSPYSMYFKQLTNTMVNELQNPYQKPKLSHSIKNGMIIFLEIPLNLIDKILDC